ncbi:MAG TPA: chloride channel protein, partial [Kiloniellales bacterium]|nr:chloride channel protein [Kiloniellales bacterium]
MFEAGGQVERAEGGLYYRITVLTVTALSVGLAVSFAAIAFVESVAWLNDALLISPRVRVQYERVGWLVPAATVLAPTAGGLLVGLLLTRLAVDRRPLGPPDVVRAVQLQQPLPDVRSGIVSTCAAAVSLGFGASVGQYGPMVYLGALVGDAIKRLRLRVANLPAIGVACGVAAAISTAFNAPIAGLVFAHEVVLR